MAELKLFPGMKVWAVCAARPDNKDGYWLSVYTANDGLLQNVTAALKDTWAMIDQGAHGNGDYHDALHSGNNYGMGEEIAVWLMENDKTKDHKHYEIESDDLTPVLKVLAALTSEKA